MIVCDINCMLSFRCKYGTIYRIKGTKLCVLLKDLYFL
jgi:hypothetical protein